MLPLYLLALAALLLAMNLGRLCPVHNDGEGEDW